MEKETVQIFDAPWEAVNHMHVITSNGDPVCVTCNEKHANRLARLPELYDALVQACIETCQHCVDELTDCEDCKWNEWAELTKKVKDGK